MLRSSDCFEGAPRRRISGRRIPAISRQRHFRHANVSVAARSPHELPTYEPSPTCQFDRETTRFDSRNGQFRCSLGTFLRPMNPRSTPIRARPRVRALQINGCPTPLTHAPFHAPILPPATLSPHDYAEVRRTRGGAGPQHPCSCRRETIRAQERRTWLLKNTKEALAQRELLSGGLSWIAEGGTPTRRDVRGVGGCLRLPFGCGLCGLSIASVGEQC